MTKRFIIPTIILFAFVIAVDFFLQKTNLLAFGKDNGLIARIVLTILGSILFRVIIKNKLTINNIIIGFSIGILSYIIVFLLYMLVSLLIYKDNRGLDFSLLTDQLIATTMIIIIGRIRFKNDKEYPTGAGLRQLQ